MGGVIVLACGDRHWTDALAVEWALEYLRTHRDEPLTVIEGGARGADSIAGRWAARHRAVGVGWIRFPAEWNRYGKRAGPVRNQQMLDYLLQGRQVGQTVGVLAFHGDLEQSRGTKDMVTRAKRAGVPVKHVSHAASRVPVPNAETPSTQKD